MPLSRNLQDREFDKFVEVAGETHVRTTASVSGLGNILEGITFDQIVAAYPDAVTETYTYNLAAVQQAVLTVVYTDATKEFIASVTRT